MIKLEAGVGKGLKNNLHDVALVQAGLKLIRHKGKPYFSGRINGKVSLELFDAIEMFYQDQFGAPQKNVVQTGARIGSKEARQIKPGSSLLSSINRKMPSSVSLIAAIRHTALLYIRGKSQAGKASQHTAFPFPLAIGKSLTKAFDALFSGYGNQLNKSQHITAAYSDFDVTAAGKYKVLISFPAIKFIDPATAKPSSVLPSEFARIIRADLRQADWKIGQIQPSGGQKGVFATSIKSAPFKGTALKLPKTLTGVSITEIMSQSPDRVARKMMTVCVVHIFDISSRLVTQDIRELVEVLQRFAGSFVKDYEKLLKKIKDGPPTAFGCGSIDFDALDNPLGYNFLPACEAHDKRYTYLNWTKEEADDAFRDDLLEICKNERLTTVANVLLFKSILASCEAVAHGYWIAVVWQGQSAYDDGQLMAQTYGWFDPEKPYDPEIHGRFADPDLLDRMRHEAAVLKRLEAIDSTADMIRLSRTDLKFRPKYGREQRNL